MTPEVDKSKKALILAHGEVTGHYHGIDIDEVEVHEDFFAVSKPEGATLTHQEHNAVTLPPDEYDSGIIRETDHITEEVRNVAD